MQRLVDVSIRSSVPAFALVGLVVASTVLSPWLTDEAPPKPDAWLTEADQESLADVLSGRGWVAGCLWEEDRDPADIRTVLPRPRGGLDVHTFSSDRPKGGGVTLGGRDRAEWMRRRS